MLMWILGICKNTVITVNANDMAVFNDDGDDDGEDDNGGGGGGDSRILLKFGHGISSG